MICHEWGKYQEGLTTSGIYLWSFAIGFTRVYNKLEYALTGILLIYFLLDLIENNMSVSYFANSVDNKIPIKGYSELLVEKAICVLNKRWLSSRIFNHMRTWVVLYSICYRSMGRKLEGELKFENSYLCHGFVICEYLKLYLLHWSFD